METREDRNIWSSVTYADALAARAWLADLGFTEGICVTDPDDPQRVVHSEMLWPEGGRVMVHSACDDDHLGTAPGTTGCYVVTAHVDDVWARAQRLGATVVRPVEDTDYGSRGFSVLDPQGNGWSFGTYAG